MAETKKRLGRGLDSLLSSTRMQELEEAVEIEGESSQPTVNKEVRSDSVLEIPIDKIHKNPHQPRQNWDEGKLLELSSSIKTNGIIQPILVRPMGEGYQLIAGERRLRAAQMAGKPAVPAILKQATEEQVLEWALIENIHRTDLSALERAKAYQHYITSFSLTQQEAAGRLSEDRSTIANYIRLLELPEEIQQMLTEGNLSMGHGRALLAVTDAGKQKQLAEAVRKKNISVRELERQVQQIQKGTEEKVPQEEKSANVLELEREFTQSLGTKVTIKTIGKKKRRGRIIIDYYSLDDFDRIRDKLR